MRKDTIQYILINPLFVFSENETPLERDKKLQQFFDSPQTIQEVLVSVENTDKIRKQDITLNEKSQLAELISTIIRIHQHNIVLSKQPIDEFAEVLSTLALPVSLQDH